MSESLSKILKKVDALSIRTRHLASDLLSGSYQSAFKGQGMDFEEVRAYIPGDDVRFIDWNVTAKMDRPFIKVYREERELTLFLCIDLSASGEFGSGNQSKRELMAEIASVLAFSAIQNNDKIGLILFTDQIEKMVPARKGRRQVLRLVRDILYHQPQNCRTDFAIPLQYLRRIQKRKAVVFFISDFLQDQSGKPLELGSPAQARLLMRFKQTKQLHDLICLSVNDPREEAIPDVGDLTLQDLETGELVSLPTGKSAFREAFRKKSLERIAQNQKAFRKAGIDLIPLITDQPYAQTLRNFFQKRPGR